MLPLLASVDQLEARMSERLETTDMIRAEALLEDASALIRQEAGEDWVDDNGELAEVPDIIVTVTVAVARRALTNPDQLQSESISSDAYSYTRTNSSDVYLKAAERKAIRRAVGRSSAGSVEFETPWNIANTLYAPVAGGGDPMPWDTAS